jgi:hypothetical protein
MLEFFFEFFQMKNFDLHAEYNIDITKSPVAWGHITCDGSVANLESMWAGNSSIVPYYQTSVDLE